LNSDIKEYNKEFKELHGKAFKAAKPATEGAEEDTPGEASTSGKQEEGVGTPNDVWKAFMAGGGFEGSDEHLAQYAQRNEGEVGDGEFSQE